MVSWFAGALMRGYDERHWQTLEYARQVRRAVFPWLNWRHWAVAGWFVARLRNRWNIAL